MTGMHAAYAFLLGHVLSIYMAREHSTSMSQVRCHDIRVVAPHTSASTLPSRKTHLQLIASQYHTGAVHFSPYLHLCV